MQVLVCFLVLLVGALASPLADVNERILGGTDVTRGQYPFMISLHYCGRTSCQHACGGALIGYMWIVSAAICLTQVPSTGYYVAIGGIVDLNDTITERQEIRISHAFIAPDFEGGAGPHDLALFKTVTPFELNQYIQPITLLSESETYDGTGDLIGWGSIGGIVSPIMPNTLQQATVPIISYDDCKATLDRLFDNHTFDAEANICAGPLNGVSNACTGDNGTPLIKDNRLIGVVSWLITPCDRVNVPTILTKLSYYRSWILSTASVL
ncbi:hypothetical protein NQ318_014099 [Aromia moschata]|uniref:Peptidase S1 domain-containing protein n=1 Tax=Aromia moschata TaxID=1265417 RepID=A0AAV8YY68_9CUCU|nr:hypothetical protein NQ318_014099 [Aromia moschata]